MTRISYFQAFYKPVHPAGRFGIVAAGTRRVDVHDRVPFIIVPVIKYIKQNKVKTNGFLCREKRRISVLTLFKLKMS
jgi:hypothetical protein